MHRPALCALCLISVLGGCAGTPLEQRLAAGAALGAVAGGLAGVGIGIGATVGVAGGLLAGQTGEP